MNTITKPILKKSIKSFLHANHVSSERHVEGEYKNSLHSSLQTVDAVQVPEERKSPLIIRRPLPPAKPPMRW